MVNGGYEPYSRTCLSFAILLIIEQCSVLVYAQQPTFENLPANKSSWCPNVQLPDYVDYVVAIGGLPGGGGRTVVYALEMLFDLYFGERGKDIYFKTLDSSYFINLSKVGPQGATDIGYCSKCGRSDAPAKYCAVQKVIGPLGTSPDYYREADRKRICETMGRITNDFQERAFVGGRRIWIFKYAETIMFLPLLERVWGDRLRFILNVRNPKCQENFHYFDLLETLECFHLRKDHIWDTLVAVDSQYSRGNPQRKDLFHSITFHDLLMPTWIWLHQMMTEKFVIVRHEDLLTEEGVENFANNIEHLLNVEKVGNAIAIAAKMASVSKTCKDRDTPIYQSKRREVQKLMSFFNYTATYYDMQTLLK